MNKHDKLRVFTAFQHWLGTHYANLPTDSGNMTERARRYINENPKELEKLPLLLPNVSGSDFWVECNVCKQQLKNWTGSTPCCGSIAWLVEDGKPTTKINLFASLGGEPIKPTEIYLGDGKNHCN